MIAPLRKQRRAFEKQHHDRFLEMLPLICRQARIAFRNLRSEYKTELIQEVVANVFVAFVQLVRREKADLAYPTPLADYAIRQVIAGRRVGTKLNSRDVSSIAARRLHGFSLESLQGDACGSRVWVEILADNRLTPIPDQVAFRIDFSAWLRIQNWRTRQLAKFLAVGNTATEAARHFGISEARVSQVRSKLYASWQEFQGQVA